MRAMAQKTWRNGEPMVLTELPDPAPKKNELRVRVKAAGVNPVDWKMRSQGPLRLAARLFGPPAPVVVGIDFAGVVDAVGADVRGVKVGDAVVGGTDFSKGQRGSYADTVIVREPQVCVLPPGFDPVIAAALPVAGVTAWMALAEIGRLEAGQAALVLGASGGVGQFAVQLAKLRGARVVGVCSAKNVPLVQGLGADAVVDYTKGDPLEQARALGPYQTVVDCAGGYSGAKCRSLLASGGRHVMVAGDSPAAMVQVLVPPFTSRPILGRSTTARLKVLVDAVVAGKLRVNVAERLPLAEAERAHELSRSGRMTGKVVLLP